MVHVRGDFMKLKKLVHGWIACLPVIFMLGLQVHADVILPPPDGDITLTDAWSTANDSGSVINSKKIVTDSIKGNVLELNYDLGTGTYVQIQSPAFPTIKNLAALGNAQGGAVPLIFCPEGA